MFDQFFNIMDSVKEVTLKVSVYWKNLIPKQLECVRFTTHNTPKLPLDG